MLSQKLLQITSVVAKVGIDTANNGLSKKVEQPTNPPRDQINIYGSRCRLPAPAADRAAHGRASRIASKEGARDKTKDTIE